MIYIRTKENQGKHDLAVGNWARQVIVAGWSRVWSDLPGNIKPPVVGGFIPDIYANHNGQEYIIEIETQDSVSATHALAQKAVFQRWANNSTIRRFEIKVV